MPSKGAVDEFCDVKQSSQGSKEQTSQACRWVLHIAYSHLSSPRCYWVPWQKTDFLAKNRIFRTKKRLHLDSNHVLATTGKSCANKVPFSYTNFGKFWVIFCEFFWPINRFLVKCKNGNFSIILPGPGPLSLWVIFLMARTVQPSFVDHSPSCKYFQRERGVSLVP